MNVLITGASAGIGRGIAIACAEAGHGCALLARNQERLDECAAACRQRGVDVATASCDVGDAGAVLHHVGELHAALGGIDAVVNNAGVVTRKPVADLTIDEWDEMVAANLDGPSYVVKAALPALRASEHAHIVNISSISGRLFLPGGSGYAATKFGVTGWSESIFQELRDDGIKVTVVFPGSVDSASHRHGDGDHSWKLTALDIGAEIAHLLATPANLCPSRLELRPVKRAPRR